MSSLITISEKPLSDPFYRYMRHKLDVESKSRSTIVNMKQVASEIMRDPEDVVKYFGLCLSVPAKYNSKSGSAAIGKKLSQVEAEQVLQQFIVEFVLCSSCGLPELTLSYSEKSGKIKSCCRSCPTTARMKVDNKFTTYLAKRLTKAKAADPSPKSAKKQETVLMLDNQWRAGINDFKF